MTVASVEVPADHNLPVRVTIDANHIGAASTRRPRAEGYDFNREGHLTLQKLRTDTSLFYTEPRLGHEGRSWWLRFKEARRGVRQADLQALRDFVAPARRLGPDADGITPFRIFQLVHTVPDAPVVREVGDELEDMIRQNRLYEDVDLGFAMPGGVLQLALNGFDQPGINFVNVGQATLNMARQWLLAWNPPLTLARLENAATPLPDFRPYGPREPTPAAFLAVLLSRIIYCSCCTRDAQGAWYIQSAMKLTVTISYSRFLTELPNAFVPSTVTRTIDVPGPIAGAGRTPELVLAQLREIVTAVVLLIAEMIVHVFEAFNHYHAVEFAIALTIYGVRIFFPRFRRQDDDGNFFPAPPFENGQLALNPPGFPWPHGGCMTASGELKGLFNAIEKHVQSNDLEVKGAMDFDNNCGLRELIYAFALSSGRVVDLLNLGPRALYQRAAELRCRTAGIPAIVRLSPAHLELAALTLGRSAECEIALLIYQLPASNFCDGRLYANDVARRHGLVEEQLIHTGTPRRLLMPVAELPNNYFGAFCVLVLGARHYYGVKDETQTREETWERFRHLCSLRWCVRCRRFIFSDIGLQRTHAWELDRDGFAPCAPRKDKRKRVRSEQELEDEVEEQITIMHRAEAGSLSRTFSAVHHAHPNTLTAFDHVGFMDLETWRRPGLNDFHEVYAVGWLRCASKDVQPKDVELFTIFDDLDTQHGALVLALASLVAFVVSKPDDFTRKKPYYLYLYNGSGFDNMFILHVMTSYFNTPPCDMTLKDGRLLSMVFLDGCLVVRDLWQFTRCSLAAACKQYRVSEDLTKGDFDHNAVVSLDAIRELWADIDKYLRNDLTALNMVYVGFSEAAYGVFGLDPCKRITMSHLAYDYWKTKLSRQALSRVTLPRDYDQYVDVSRACIGGRVYPVVRSWISSDYVDGAAYDSFHDYLMDLDVVSLYPSAMYYAKVFALDFLSMGGRNMPLYFCGEPRHCAGDDVELESIRHLIVLGVDRAKDRTPDIAPLDFWYHLSNSVEGAFRLSSRGALVCVDWSVDPLQPPDLPLLPHKTLEGDTAWDLRPHESQWYVLEEVLNAVVLGYRVDRLRSAYIYPCREKLFDQAMETLMAGKAACQRGDPRRDQYKLGANSIYGKHGQKPILERVRVIDAHQLEKTMTEEHVLNLEPICCDRDHETLMNYHRILKESKLAKPQNLHGGVDSAGELIERMGDEGVAPSAFVVTSKSSDCLPSKPTYLSAQVTAYSRVHMNWFIERLGLVRFSPDSPEKTLYYTDTDSLIVHAKSCEGQKYLFGNELGKLDDELMGGRIVEYVSLAPKTYALAYVMPCGRRFLKIRCKGFPHPKETLEYGDGKLHDLSKWMVDGRIDPSKIDLKEQIYVTRKDDDETYYRHLTPSIFRQLIDGEIDEIAVYFTSMRRVLFGAHSLGHVSGIQHHYATRSLKTASWWDNYRVESGGFFYPKGHPIVD